MTLPYTAPEKVRYVAWKLESARAEAIATPSTYWATSPLSCPVWDVDMPYGYKAEADPSVRPSMLARGAQILSAKEGKASFKARLSGINAQAAAGTAIAQDALGALFEAAWGGQSLGTSRAVGPGTSSTTVVLVANTTGLTLGAAVCINGECRRITAVTGNTSITLDHALSAAPVEGDLIVAGETTYLDPDGLADLSNAAHKTFALLGIGAHAEDQVQLRGCFPEIEIGEIVGGKNVVLTITMHPLTGEYVSSVALASATAEGVPIIAGDGATYMNVVGTATLNELWTPKLAVKSGIKVEPQPGPGGPQGIEDHAVFDVEPTLEFDTPFDADWKTWYEGQAGGVAGSNRYAGVQIGKPDTTRGCAFISFPSLYIDEMPKRGGKGAVLFSVKLHGDRNATTTTDLQASPIAITRFPHL